jgi:hypothetical protein
MLKSPEKKELFNVQDPNIIKLVKSAQDALSAANKHIAQVNPGPPLGEVRLALNEFSIAIDNIIETLGQLNN